MCFQHPIEVRKRRRRIYWQRTPSSRVTSRSMMLFPSFLNLSVLWFDVMFMWLIDCDDCGELIDRKS